ncbi:RimJ/RimL family protein N-acetyltransferase [Actinoplanes octamycinicus]|uniref:RimJ/RimL family protein N-acetyltransferase n=1 Tax=Actinoplanes octamycinicus TaxID=135948 RepID=A0A7W7H238_9ACTN|nr:GNAT family protein [Actinoplanes octamycinicus]MBB4742588.1 RimJ/RimL family protein N-acetyltransferase [Actinoplanes octamycinicus]
METPRLRLRPLEAGDAAGVQAVWNDRVFLRFAPVGFRYAGAGLDRAVEWCSRGVDGLAGVARENGRLACHVGLFDTDWSAMTTEIHYWTAGWARGRGFAVEAAAAVARWAVAQAGMQRVTLHADTRNEASLRVAQRAGFRFEGVLRNASWTRSGRGDLAVYSLIPADLSEVA